MNENVLEINNLKVSFDTYAGEVQAVRGVTFNVANGEVLAIVGESGCGKSVTAQTIMKLNPMPPARIKDGSVILDGKDIVAASEKEMQNIRGTVVSMIFQDPMTSLNPTMTVGKQLTEAIVKHQKISKEEARKEAVRLLKLVQIPNPEQRAKQYPHEFSGGMRQRVMIAMALSCNPKLLIADEPTTALDVTIQAQIMDLMADLKKELGTSIILITHDLGVVANLADNVAVMYAGKIVEKGAVDDIFYNPSHPYTTGLLDSLPRVDSDRSKQLLAIDGTPPDLFAPPVGCEFADRCKYCMNICKEHVPPLYEVSPNHFSACWMLHPECDKKLNRGGAVNG
ncbi:ABC transporter ATP-binding protein [Paludicola sp. MB14-C6]|uniref:ABC transporter ATP-binding protein n=1 Tax=Paludihabitans sp. MB14-C6 TaxID=3070656 RepID=UPI0027DDBA57|nr:ABC transporter ATP-binding protein [Paludicola sp. MB14-C6]WMJ22313.1 ABC transporter ATP-binding protein [Paludicola sp. MB14-C6]